MLKQYLLFVVLTPVLLVSLYIFAALACVLIPIGVNYPDGEKMVEILVEVSTIHTSFILPVKNDDVDFRKYIFSPQLIASTPKINYISLSWGDRDFFLETPTWNQFKIKTAFNALFRSAAAVIHIEYFHQRPNGKSYYTLHLPRDKYVLLVAYITGFLKQDENGKPKKIVGGHLYYGTDEFYEAKKSFSAFHTCNIWTSNGLKLINYKTAVWSPFPLGIKYYLNK